MSRVSARRRTPREWMPRQREPDRAVASNAYTSPSTAPNTTRFRATAGDPANPLNAAPAGVGERGVPRPGTGGPPTPGSRA